MCAYKTPGVSVVSQFQPLVNPVAGSDRMESILAGVDTNNLYVYPTRIMEFRRKGLGVGSKAAVDFSMVSKPTDPLKSLTIADRIIEFSQGNVVYTRSDGSSGADVYAEVLTLTRGTTGTDEVTGTEVVGYSNSYFTEGYGADLGKAYVYYYNEKDGTLTLCVEGTDFTVVYSAGTGGKVKATITWLDFTLIPSGSTYYGIMIYGDNLPAGPTELDGYYFAHVVGGATSPTLGVVTYWFSASGTPQDSSVYYGDIRIEMPSSPKIFTSPDEAAKTFGPMVNPINIDEINEPTFGAYIALAEQAPSVMVVPYDLNNPGTIDDALNVLGTTDEPNWVASFSGDDPSDTGISNNINDKIYDHVLAASSDTSKKFRMALIHAYNAGWTDFTTALAGYDNLTQYLNSNRVMTFGPLQATVSVPVPPYGVNRQYTFNGGILSIILGAMWSRSQYDVATSMLRKPSNTLVSLSPILDDVKMDKIASKAITLFAKINGRYTVRDDLTTSRANLILETEPTITMISDDIARSAIRLFDASLIGTKISIPLTLETIKTEIVSLLDGKVRDGIITAFGTPQVTVDPNDPRRLNVTIPCQPTFTLKYLNIQFSYVASL